MKFILIAAAALSLLLLPAEADACGYRLPALNEGAWVLPVMRAHFAEHRRGDVLHEIWNSMRPPGGVGNSDRFEVQVFFSRDGREFSQWFSVRYGTPARSSSPATPPEVRALEAPVPRDPA